MSVFKKNILFSVILTASCFVLLTGCNQSKDNEAYLFAYFTGNAPGEEAIRFALSIDGYNYRALNNNEPILDSKEISTTGGVRDPHILRSADGKTFYMVVTDLYVTDMGWENYAMVLLKSTDLINWQSSVVNIPEAFPNKFGDVWRVWAPQIIYDDATGKSMIYFSMKQGDDPDIIYYAYANDDFTSLESEPKQLLHNPTNNSCIDGDIVKKDGKFFLFHKSESGEPGIKLAISDKLTEGYEYQDLNRVDKEIENVEGSGVFKLNNKDEWILMYDVYSRGRYQFTRSSDLKHFEVIDEDISMNFYPRHGTVLPITLKEYHQLIKKWGITNDPLVEIKSSELKKINIVFDTEASTIHLSVNRGVDLTSFDPQFSCWPGFSVKPFGPQDFSMGAVNYTFSIDGANANTVFQVTASEDHNPVLEGFYADPDILYSEKTDSFYIYPTSDGFDSWSGWYFKAFSSDNMVDWNDEGIILDLHKDVSWANRRAWAPCIVEKKINGEYKYFYYFTAFKKIGVAVADHPTGPFVDSGKELVDFTPKGVSGVQIDPDVFTDPETGKSYLYWGNGYMAGAELNEDMVSLKLKTLKTFNIDTTYTEGTYVICRNGTYYFMWSEDDTRSPNYKVRYAITDSPLGILTYPENNIVIKRDSINNIFATGHNSAIQIPGKDEWYLVYHRFTYPTGVGMPRGAGGYHREVCIDKMDFDTDGNIIEVKPTFKGIDPVR